MLNVFDFLSIFDIVFFPENERKDAIATDNEVWLSEERRSGMAHCIKRL